MISAHHSATSKISRYLHRLLRPILADVLHGRLFTDEADFIQKLIQYSQVDQHLQPNTLFATIRITNPQSIVSHASLVETFGYFMRNNTVSNAIQYTSMRPVMPQYIAISTVTRLTELFLQHNLFYYQDKIYGFNKSGPNSLQFSDDLLEIYLFAWQRSVFGHERLKFELYGRYGIYVRLTLLRRHLFSRVHFLGIDIQSFSPGINPKRSCATFFAHRQNDIRPYNCRQPLVEAYNFSIRISRIVRVACILAWRMRPTLNPTRYLSWSVTPK
jgi:hypothetical protein